METRNPEIAVISDVHLGTFGCQAKQLNNYLKSINPKILVLNGDIIDIWQFNKRYWPDSHMKIIHRIIKMIDRGTKVYYLTGNHDEMLRRFTDFQLHNFSVLNKLVLEVDGKKMWFFHGDVFDVTMKHSKWLAKLGGWGYDLLIMINSVVNFVSNRLLRRGKISLSKKIKNSVKQAIRFISDFEQTAMEIAIENGYDFVICGHIHQPSVKNLENHKGKVTYLNSGDWIENLTSLEYQDGEWEIIRYQEDTELLPDENDTIPSILIQHLYEDIVRHTGNRQWSPEQGKGNNTDTADLRRGRPVSERDPVGC